MCLYKELRVKISSTDIFEFETLRRKLKFEKVERICSVCGIDKWNLSLVKPQVSMFTRIYQDENIEIIFHLLLAEDIVYIHISIVKNV